MRYSVKQYAAALVSALGGKSASQQKEMVRRFLSLVRRHGLWSRRMLIMEEVERQYLKAQGTTKVVVASAAPLIRETRQEIERMIGKNIFWQERVEPELLAGMKILINEEVLIDATGKTQLERLFNS